MFNLVVTEQRSVLEKSESLKKVSINMCTFLLKNYLKYTFTWPLSHYLLSAYIKLNNHFIKR